MPAWDDFRVQGNIYPEPLPGKALVYFYKELQWDGVTYYVWDNDKKIGAAGGGYYFFYHADPGERFFWAETEVKRFLPFRVEAGKTYFIHMSWEIGFWAGHPVFARVPEQIGYQAIRGMKYATVQDTQ
jgi:hypothetical protein